MFRRFSGLVLVAVMVGGVLGQPVPAVATTASGVEVEASAGLGPVINRYGYDIKQAGRAGELAGNDALAQRVFGRDGVAVLRIPIYATGDAHPGPGRIRTDVHTRNYQVMRRAIATAQRARPGVMLFASLRLDPNRGPEFADWTKPATDAWSGVNPDAYARLLYDYLRWMHRGGDTVAMLGPDNESQFNEGYLGAPKFIALVRALRQLCRAGGVPMPRIVGPDDFKPQSQFLSEIDGNAGWDTIHVGGSHYYTRFASDYYHARTRTVLAQGAARGLPHWVTEFHWNRLDVSSLRSYTGREQLTDAVMGLGGAFHLFDNGARGLTWWSYRHGGGARASLQQALVRSTVGARPFRHTDDIDGTSAGAGRITTRAFRKGDSVRVWIVNDTTRHLGSTSIRLAGLRVTGRPTYQQWHLDPDGKVVHRSGLTGWTKLLTTDTAVVPVGAKSITQATIPIR